MKNIIILEKIKKKNEPWIVIINITILAKIA